ncbi:hypothetical protein C8Q74DRAFT_1370535 [Fomes fomentarius]|nr:hypothetical protein C8Q74DRAFT_1370535 [Fomes fomentarius]
MPGLLSVVRTISRRRSSSSQDMQQPAFDPVYTLNELRSEALVPLSMTLSDDALQPLAHPEDLLEDAEFASRRDTASLPRGHDDAWKMSRAQYPYNNVYILLRDDATGRYVLFKVHVALLACASLVFARTFAQEGRGAAHYNGLPLYRAPEGVSVGGLKDVLRATKDQQYFLKSRHNNMSAAEALAFISSADALSCRILLEARFLSQWLTPSYGTRRPEGSTMSYESALRLVALGRKYELDRLSPWLMSHALYQVFVSRDWKFYGCLSRIANSATLEFAQEDFDLLQKAEKLRYGAYGEGDDAFWHAFHRAMHPKSSKRARLNVFGW